jgi:hypothetical protein
MAWKNQKYFIVRFRVIAGEAGLGSLSVGAFAIPRVGAIYGGETVAYKGARKTAYFYRTGTASYWGIKALNPAVTGVNILDWDVYSIDPNADAAADSTRYAMANYTKFDSNLVAGSNGSAFNVNSGKITLNNKGDSATFYYAVGFGTTENDLFASIDSATAKYTKITTSVRRDYAVQPAGFSLEQNYPNPFNPSTSIQFSVGTSSVVSLKVYDALGREVRSLVNESLETGVYTVPVDASGLSSGVYYYTLQSGTFRASRKMQLMK